MISDERQDAALTRYAERMGQAAFARRFAVETESKQPNSRQSSRLRQSRILHRLMRFSLNMTGLMQRGLANFHDIELVRRELRIANLPAAFDGYRILHLADLHIDLRPELLTPAVLAIVESVECDLCVNTGDYVIAHRKWATAFQELRQIHAAVGVPHFGILGNHDSLGLVADLESTGHRLLLNESVKLTRDGAELWLAGVDDPHYFESDDLDHALRDIPQVAGSRPATLLLAHTPAFAEKAAASGRVDAMLCGHTHGGQMCLPGGWALVTHADCPRERLKGAWQIGTMSGYTSRGAGASGLAARFNCRPEITLHTLRPA